jgi:hypothetical protein
MWLFGQEEGDDEHQQQQQQQAAMLLLPHAACYSPYLSFSFAASPIPAQIKSYQLFLRIKASITA